MLKMATYPGMSLGGEIRESISLDEDDLSDVEDEVFIRDGKNSYKLAEEINVKRPLMAPRRKIGTNDISRRLKNRPSWRAFCKPCWYFLATLSALVGLIILLVILVSIFPLPMDRVRDWLVFKSTAKEPFKKLLPCSKIKISDVWTVNLPKFTTDSPVRTLDVNSDGWDDVLFGFGSGDNYDILPPDIFCTIFIGVPAPCKGGVIALNGVNGDIIWRYWTNDTIYYIQCSEDINSDGLEDCLAFGIDGSISLINTKNGTLLWKIVHGKLDVCIGDFIPDQNNDNISDIIIAHTNLKGTVGHLMLLCGKTGKRLKSVPVPNEAKTFYMPQILQKNSTDFVIIGTGSPSTPGNLSIIELNELFNHNSSFKTLYQDRYKGIMSQSVLVDITGDGIPDVITAIYNSTVVATNGDTYEQIWNFSNPNAETNIMPTPGYFNYDNVTDFLIIYEKYDKILNYNYTQSYILDGKTGIPIYDKPISDSVTTQIGAITLSMESYGFDMFVYWTSACKSMDIFKKIDIPLKGITVDPLYDSCHRQSNTTTVMKLHALNQFDQPPGVELYNSLNRTILEFNNIKSTMQQFRDYVKSHPKFGRNRGQTEVDESYSNEDPQQIRIHKYGSSNFRHKDNRQGLLKDYAPTDNNGAYSNTPVQSKNYNSFYQNIEAPLDDDDYYNVEDESTKEDISTTNNRDPRSKINKSTTKSDTPISREYEQNVSSSTKTLNKTSSSKKKNLSQKNDIYGYKNIRMAGKRLLHDLNYVPDDILRDTYYKNEESKLETTKFEQRDLNSHKEREKLMRRTIEEREESTKNASLNLWNLESEKEVEERENGYWRNKRESNYSSFDGLRKITSVGAVVKSGNATNCSSSIDIVFITYWQPDKFGPRDNLESELNECVDEKLTTLTKDSSHMYQKTTEEEKKALFLKECMIEQATYKENFPFFQDIFQLNFGQMTVYKLRIECECRIIKDNQKCANFLPPDNQTWPNYMGKLGDGQYRIKV